jgi:cytochrome c biogenesis protein CcmG/thiol:disulfide interchange protein DsbE
LTEVEICFILGITFKIFPLQVERLSGIDLSIVMKKKTLFSFLLMMLGVGIYLISLMRAGDLLAAPPDCPSCSSFGVQGFPPRVEAPPFSLKGLDGKTVSLSDFKGKPVLLVFWATWCPSCKEDIVLMEKFSIGKRDQLTILLLTIDGERQKRVKRIIQEDRITLPVLLILKERIMDDYGVRGWVPITFLIDGEGLVVGKVVGERDWCSSQAWSCLKELFSLR